MAKHAIQIQLTDPSDPADPSAFDESKRFWKLALFDKDGNPVGPVTGLGIAGPPGQKGDKGDQGDVGPTGGQGEAGPPGLDGAPGTPGGIGPAGANGTGFRWRGPYAPAAAASYLTDDVVSSGGSSFIALVDSPVSAPVDNAEWDPITIAGPPGPQGNDGQPGPRGLAGADGADGAQGIQGVKGDPGPKGDKGDQGIQGVPGVAGAKGDKGDKGDPGDPGAAGSGGGGGGGTVIPFVDEKFDAEPANLHYGEGVAADLVFNGVLKNTPGNSNAVNIFRSGTGLQAIDSAQILKVKCGTGGSVQAALLSRRIDDNDFLMATVFGNATSAALALYKKDAGVWTALGANTPLGVSMVAGSVWWLVFYTVGAHLRAELWAYDPRKDPSRLFGGPLYTKFIDLSGADFAKFGAANGEMGLRWDPASAGANPDTVEIDDWVGLSLDSDKLDRAGFMPLPSIGSAPGPSVLASLIWSANGDTNGLMHWLGTDGETVAWANPITGGKLSASYGTALLGGSPAATVDRDPSTMFQTTDVANSYIEYDLGVGKAFKPTKYTLRARDYPGANHNPENWKLQGSNDGIAWTDLDVRVNDTQLAGGASAWGDYTVSGVTQHYRYLKLIQTGLNESGANYFTLAEVEFYGELID